MCVHNGLPFLNEAIESILNQSFCDFEFIIINDGSTDDSSQVIDAFAIRDRRIILVNQDHAGLVRALNRGLAMARAPVIARMDADDIALPERLARQYAHLMTKDDLAILGTAVSVIDADGRIVHRPNCIVGSDAVAKAMRTGPSLAHPSVLMRRDVLLELGGYRMAYQHAEDYDLWLRVIERYKIDNLPEVLLLYRQHDRKVSSRYAFAQALASNVAKATSRLRRRNKPDPTNSLNRPFDIFILDDLELDQNEMAQIHCFLLEILLNGRDWRSDEAVRLLRILIERALASAGDPGDVIALQMLIIRAAPKLIRTSHQLPALRYLGRSIKLSPHLFAVSAARWLRGYVSSRI